jgi:CubicO group peptidase (beta-lactamase class C family)
MTTSQQVAKAMQLAIDEHGEIGLQVAAYLDGELVVDECAGVVAAGSVVSVDGDTLFNAFSVSKAITATAIHILFERGHIDYYAPIAQYWPEFGANGKHAATVYDMLTHRLGTPLMPPGVTPELMCDWDWMTTRLAESYPLFEPGTKSAYMSYTFGWIAGELVQRTDPKSRPFGQFVQQEICDPLGIDALWFGIPEGVDHRIAELKNMALPTSASPTGVVSSLAIPAAVAPTQQVFGRADVRRATLPGAGGIMNARSMARFFAALAGGGELDGVRLLSADRVRVMAVQAPPASFDFTNGVAHKMTIGGFHLTGGPLMAPAGSSPTAFGHPGAGASVGWADPATGLAVGITHNRMFHPVTIEENVLKGIGEAVRTSLRLAP